MTDDHIHDETLPNPSEAVSLALNTLTSQIRNILLMPATSAKLAIESFESLLVANMQMVSESANAQVDEMNGLMDELEARDREIDQLHGAITALKLEAVEQAERVSQDRANDATSLELKEKALFELQYSFNKLENQHKATLFENAQQARTINEYQQMDPAGLKRKVREKNKVAEDLRAEIAQLKKEAGTSRQEILGYQKKIGGLIQAAKIQDEELAKRHRIIMEMETAKAAKTIWHNHLSNTFTGTDGTLWNVYVLDHGVKAGNAKYFINDLDWKLHAMASDGSGMTVMLHEWMEPIFPVKVGEGMPEELVAAVYNFMWEALEATHIHLIRRAEWAKTVSIHECGLTDSVANLLADNGMDTLHRVMVHQGYGGKLEKVKGLGEKRIAQILYACELKAKVWMDEYNAERRKAIADRLQGDAA